MKTTGIWIDKHTAYIFSIENGKETLEAVKSTLESSNIRSDKGNRRKGQIQDSTYQRYETHKLQQYFVEIAHVIEDTDAIVIFGPGETGGQLRKELKSHFRFLGNKILGVKKADSMSENQLKAWVRNFFEESLDLSQL